MNLWRQCVRPKQPFRAHSDPPGVQKSERTRSATARCTGSTARTRRKPSSELVGVRPQFRRSTRQAPRCGTVRAHPTTSIPTPQVFILGCHVSHVAACEWSAHFYISIPNRFGRTCVERLLPNADDWVATHTATCQLFPFVNVFFTCLTWLLCLLSISRDPSQSTGDCGAIIARWSAILHDMAAIIGGLGVSGAISGDRVAVVGGQFS